MDATTFTGMIRDGLQPVVEFGKASLDFEWCVEPGMRGKVTGIERESDETGVIQLKVELEGFQDYNEDFQSANYYNPEGDPVLTAKESGNWPKKETIFLDRDTDVDELLTVVEDYSLKLFQRYTNVRLPGQTYMNWLEQEIGTFQAILRAAGN